MLCPKCGYISFDNLSSCLKCSHDLSGAAADLSGAATRVEQIFFLGSLLKDSDFFESETSGGPPEVVEEMSELAESEEQNGALEAAADLPEEEAPAPALEDEGEVALDVEESGEIALDLGGDDESDLDLEEESVTCPAGWKTMRHRSHSGGGRTFIFDGKVCADCPSRPQCTGRDPDRMRQSGEGRTIAWHALEAVLQAARAAEATPGVQELLGLRWKVEQGIAHLVRRGLRQARYRGTRKVQFQALTAALVANLVRLGGHWAQDIPFSRAWGVA